MFVMLLALVCAQAPEREVYFPGRMWYQTTQVNHGEKITLVGHSAGATSAARFALDPKNKGKVRKVKLISGIYLITPFVRLAEVGRWSIPPRPFRGIRTRDASPIYNIPPADKDSPEFEIYYGTYDLPGQKQQAEEFYYALLCKGYRAKLYKVPGLHRFIQNVLGYFP